MSFHFFLLFLLSLCSVSWTKSPLDIAIKEKYTLPICNTIYTTENYWHNWSNCSATCGEGIQYAYLTQEGISEANEKKCEIVHRSRVCTGIECPVDCVLSDWSPYTECNIATGVKNRSRTIQVAPQYNGSPCGPLEETIACPVDCQVTDWSDYGACDITTGLKERTRNVTYPPLNNGRECPPLTEKYDCNYCNASDWKVSGECNQTTGLIMYIRNVYETGKNDTCPWLKYETCPVNCVVNEWSGWSICDKRIGQQYRTRDILYPSLNNGTECNSLLEGTQLYETQTCQVDCETTAWSDWTVCTNTTQNQQRTRDILVYPKNNGAACPSLQETKDCIDVCQSVSWSTWSVCDTTTGYRYRTRPSISDPITKASICGANQTEQCAVDAVVGDWSQWHQTSDNSTWSRDRPLIVPPQNGGQPAPPLVEYDDIHKVCANSIWSNWSLCDVTTGKQSRYRETPANLVDEFTQCNGTVQEQTCPVDCAFTDWSAWSECNNRTGFRIQTRTVTQQPLYGGNTCPNLERSEQCMTCPSSDWSAYSECFKNNGTKYRTREVYVTAVGCMSIEYTNCSVDCEMSDFGQFSQCNDNGKQTRSRGITVKPLNGGAACLPASETRDCPVNCVVSPWSEFGTCDEVLGLKNRTRTIIKANRNNGAECPALVDTVDCGGCKAGNWSSWSSCNKTSGLMKRSRSLIGPYKEPCVLEETAICAVNCEVSPWGAYSACNKTTGYKQRQRHIIAQPLNNGTSCDKLGGLIEKTTCPVDCEVSGWLPYSSCTNEGFETRYKHVIVSAKNGGKNDECVVSETRRCPVDCVIQINGNVTVAAKNGGKSCRKAATELRQRGIKINPDDYNEKTYQGIYLQAFGMGFTKQQVMAGSSALLGCMAFLIVAMVVVRKGSTARGGYTRIAERPSVAV